MKPILLLLVLLSAFAANSQDNKPVFICCKPLIPPGRIDTVRLLTPPQLLQKAIKDTMPNALAGMMQKQVFIGNNGRGFDIYVDQLDNMRVAKPDNSFYSAMPTATRKSPKEQIQELFNNPKALQQLLKADSLRRR